MSVCEKEKSAEPLLQAVRDGAQKEPTNVLFICTGNTCRSPMAAALLADRARPREICSAMGETEPLHVKVCSAGLFAMEGDPISPDTVRVLEEAGIPSVSPNDYRAHRARNVTEEMMKAADLVIPMTAEHAMQLMMRYPLYAGKIRQLPLPITDPFGQGIEAYRHCLGQLKLAFSAFSFERGETT